MRTLGRRLSLAAVMSVCGCFPAVECLTASAAASTVPIRSIALRPTQLGNGFAEKLAPLGNRVAGEVTLDLCGQSFASESLRRQRLQLIYSKPGMKAEISNEVVRYGPGGAAIAYQELEHVAASCPLGPQHGTVQGEQGISYRVTAIHVPGTLTHTLALEQRDSRGKLRVTQFAVYQFDGDYLSAVYGEGSNLDQQRALVSKAAARSASNLRHTLG